MQEFDGSLSKPTCMSNPMDLLGYAETVIVLCIYPQVINLKLHYIYIYILGIGSRLTYART